MRLLHVNANPKPTDESASKTITKAFLDELPGSVQLTSVDLYDDVPPFITYPEYRNFWYPVFEGSYEPTTEEKASAEYAARHGRMVNAADVLAITTPMWNFGVPAILKAWIDQVVMPGLTFELGPEGVKALHPIRRIIMLMASGGVYEAENATRDALTPMIRAAFGFIHVVDFDIVWASGQNSFFFTDSDERRDRAMDHARTVARSLA